MTFIENSRQSWAREDADRAVALKSEGKSIKEIAKELGRSVGSIHNLFHRLKKGPLPEGPPRKIWTNEEHELAAKMRKAGATYPEIGRRLGRSATSVECRLRLHSRGGARTVTMPKPAHQKRRWCYILGDEKVPVSHSCHLPAGGRFAMEVPT